MYRSDNLPDCVRVITRLTNNKYAANTDKSLSDDMTIIKHVSFRMKLTYLDTTKFPNTKDKIRMRTLIKAVRIDRLATVNCIISSTS